MRIFTQVILLLVSLIGFGAFGQREIALPPLRTPTSLNPIPLRITGRLPDIFLPGDSVNIPHVRTHILEYTSSVADNNILIEGLKQKGMQEGVDGILLIDFRKLIPGESMMLGSINGVGLKYLNRIDYLDTIIRQKVISTYNPSGNPGKTYILDMDWYGRILNPAGQEDLKFYSDSMAVMDVNVIFNRTLDIYSYKDFGSPLVLKIVSSEKFPSRIVHEAERIGGTINYFQSFVTPEVIEAKKWKLKIKPVYTGDLITGAIISRHNDADFPLFYLHYKYDSRGRLISERWEKLINGKRTLWLEVENRFFEASGDLIQGLWLKADK